MEHLVIIWLLTFCDFSLNVNGKANNVCHTNRDYYTVKTNPDCWYDIAAEGTAMDIIEYYGYPSETHKVTTADGYILTVFRIPKNSSSSSKGPAFLQHGVYATGATFLGLGKHSLPFMLSDAGHDVWIGNFRGTQYSEEHVNLTVYDAEYWNFGFDELGLYDIPAMLNYIVETTRQKRKILYIGHSLGTTVATIYSSEFPKQAKKIVKLFIFLGPAAPLNNMISPVKAFASLGPLGLQIVNYFDLTGLISQAGPMREIVKIICRENPLLMPLCVLPAQVLCGLRNQLEPEKLPVALNQLPGGTGVKVLVQITDMVINPFQRFNYGTKGNMIKYGTPSPPLYNYSRIQVPIYMMYSVADWICTKKDSLILYDKLPPQAKIYGIHEISVNDFNHLDFLYGRDAKSIVNDHIMKLLTKIKV